MQAAEIPGRSPFRHRVIITDQIHAAHQLHLPYESKCNKPHGHTYRLQVVIGSDELTPAGMVVDFTHVKAVIRKFDHENLNEYFQPTTAEKFGELLLDEIQSVVLKENPRARVLEVGVGETETTWCTVSYNAR